MSFASDINRYAKATKTKVKKVITDYNVALVRKVFYKTPVDTGLARGNWNSSLGAIDETITDLEDVTYSERRAVEIAKKSAGEVFWFSNSLPYIRGLEEGASSKAPAGMLRLSAEELKFELRAKR